MGGAELVGAVRRRQAKGAHPRRTRSLHAGRRVLNHNTPFRRDLEPFGREQVSFRARLALLDVVRPDQHARGRETGLVHPPGGTAPGTGCDDRPQSPRQSLQERPGTGQRLQVSSFLGHKLGEPGDLGFGIESRRGHPDGLERAAAVTDAEEWRRVESAA